MTTINLLSEGKILIGNKASIVGTIGFGDDPAIKMSEVASVKASSTFSAGIHAHYFTFGEKVEICHVPLKALFKNADDAVIVAIKQVGQNTYLQGITVPKLLEWEPPTAAATMVDEDGVLQTWKSDHEDIAALFTLEDTETHKLRAVTDKLISHLPTYRGLNLKSAKEISEWCAPPLHSLAALSLCALSLSLSLRHSLADLH